MLLHKHSLLIDLFDKNFFLFPLSFLSIKQTRCKWSVIPVYYRLHPAQRSSTCVCDCVVFIEEVNGAKLQETLNLSSTFEPGNPAFLRPNFSFYLSFRFDVVVPIWTTYTRHLYLKHKFLKANFIESFSHIESLFYFLLLFAFFSLSVS